MATLMVAGAGAVTPGCIDPESPLIQKSSEGCDEFVAGEAVDPKLDVNPKVRRFMQAASDFAKNAEAIKTEVLSACAAIATDLGASDTWSNIKDSDDAISNDQGTGACDKAGSLIEQAFIDAGTVNARIAIAVSRGECHLDFEEQKRCDAECALHESCDPGSVETRCEPAHVSCSCQGTCNANAFCIGRADVAASCMGQCEAECQGDCHGDCIAADGSVTLDNPNCQGKCSASCNGTCRGRCKIEASAGIACGADVQCTGGCTGGFTVPTCTTEFTPPSCDVDEDCHAACSAKVAEDAVCDPTEIRILADVDATPEIRAVIDTLNANLPPLFSAAERKGQLVLGAARRLGHTGESLEGRIEDLDGKSLACLGRASTAVGTTIGSIDVSVNASIKVTTTVTDSAE